MQLGEGIRKVGFRKWYERALIRSHFYLVTCIVCTVGVLSTIEVFGEATGADRLFDVFALALFGGLAVVSLRRYVSGMMHAEHTAHQATCTVCQSYGQLSVERETDDAQGARLHVRCKRCDHRWPIVLG